MENQKNNKGVIALLIVIILILLVLCILFATGTITFKSNDVENSGTNQNINDNNQVSDDNNTGNTLNDNNLEYANQTATSVKVDNLEEGNGKTIDIEIDNGNIIFKSDNKELVLSDINAKYMYLHQYMESCSTKLYFINQNNELYRISLLSLVCQYNFDKEELSVEKVTDSKVTDFLGYGYSYYRDDNMSIDTTYHNVYYLLENGNIESLVINWYKQQ